MKYKVLVVDKFNQKGIDLINSHEDIELTKIEKIDNTELEKIIMPYHALITRSQNAITKKLLSRASNLKIIGRGGVGIDNIDIDEATRLGIMVVNTPEANIVSAAELTLALMLSLSRKILSADLDIRKGQWKREKYIGHEFFNKTIGIIGLGRVGSRVATICNSFKMKVITYDPYIPKKKADDLGVIMHDLNSLLENSDYISIHTPLNKETLNMISEKEISKMKAGVFVINAARGGIINENALIENLENGKIQGAGIDVYENEPISDHKLFQFENVVLTPHIGANTHEAQERVSTDLVDSIVNGLKGMAVVNAVNLPFTLDSQSEQYLPYMNLAEKMGKFAVQFIEKPILNVTLSAFGDIKEYSSIMLTCFIKGIFSQIMSDSVNYVNVNQIAKERNLELKSVSSAEKSDYKNLIKVDLVYEGGETTISGSVFGEDHPRIINIDDYHIEIKPIGKKLVIKNLDVPGVIGKIGTIMGNSNVNIEEYFLAKKQKSDLALAIISLDSQIDYKALKQLKDFKNIQFLKEVSL
ncbi:MAG: phosphoglycerate dehydrogenase [Pseudomonadota bacterium]